MSPIDHYYEVLDYINELEVKLSRLPASNGAPVDRIDNYHQISKNLHELLKLATVADRAHWKSLEEVNPNTSNKTDGEE